MKLEVERFFLYLRTIYYLKPIQIRYRIFYFLKNKLSSFFDIKVKLYQPTRHQFLSFSNLPKRDISYLGSSEFSFLNLNYKFERKIEWNYDQYGKLWTYNLCYFDYLLQEDISEENAFILMKSFALDYQNIKDGLEPYPTSLRIINWVKFVSTKKKSDDLINQMIFSDLVRLSKNVEYHLMGNHLLENAFALFIGGLFFQEEKILAKSIAILEEQLEEQVLEDGAHFELSPMYHQVILSRILDCLNVIHNDAHWENESLLKLLTEKAHLMLAWLNNMIGNERLIPPVNDAINVATNHSKVLFKYASSIGISAPLVSLGRSGYRRYDFPNYSLLLDVGNIGPDYIPGHAHSDTFNFLLSINSQPVFVDTGISTYEKNERRHFERSTKSHNTVEVNGKDQSEVWGGFRVGRRAKSVVIREEKNSITASHNGYEHLGIIHTRSFQCSDDELLFHDILNEKANGIAYFHFHPDLQIHQNAHIISFELGQMIFNKHANIEMANYQYAIDFNKTQKAVVVAVHFNQILETKISVGGAN